MRTTHVKFDFDKYALDTNLRELRRDGELVAMQPQVFDLLVYLLKNRDRVVSKDDLIASVWGGRIVRNRRLTSRINAARKAIGDSGEEQRLIRTIAAQGHSFRRRRAMSGRRRHRLGADGAGRTGCRPLPLPDRPAIAVLPFDNMSGDPEQEYFSDGISEDIITALSKLRWFFVIARNSSFIYKGKAVHMKQVADELGVRYVVEGSVRKSGDRVRITAQLNDVATGSHIWAERYDRDLADVFAVQDEITEAIVAAIEPQIYAAEKFRAQRKPPEQPGRVGSGDAGAVALLARDAAGQRGGAGAAGEGDRDRSELRPGAGVLATSHMFSVHMGWADMATAAPIAERAALAAIPADSEDPVGAYRARPASISSPAASTIRWPNSSWRCSSIRTSRWRRAITALALSYCGRWQEADAAAQRAMRLSPRDPSSAIYYGVAAYAQFVGSELRRGDRAGARGDPPTRRSQRRLPGADGRRRHGRQDRRRQGRARRNCGGPNPISRWPGSRRSCPGSSTPIASIIWKVSAAQGWNDLHRGGVLAGSAVANP